MCVAEVMEMNDKTLIVLFVGKAGCGLENQNTVSREAITSDMVSLGGYELLEKQNEEYGRR